MGDRLEAYRALQPHVLLVAGTKSPEHLRRRIELLQQTLPSSNLHWMPGASHSAAVTKTRDVAQLLLADIASATPGR